MRSEVSHSRLYLLVAVMTALWSFNYIVVKYALREFPPLLASGIRMLLAGALMLGVYAWHARRDKLRAWNRSDVPVLIFLGMLGVGLNQLCFVLGIARTSVGHAALIIALSPMLVLLIASAVGQERLTGGKAIGMALAISGVGILQLASADGRQASLRGDLLIFLAGLTFAIFTVKGKEQATRLGGVTLNTFAYVGSGIALLPVTLHFSQGFRFLDVTPLGWACIAYMAVFPSVICYLIYYYALSHIPASRVSAFSYLQPLFATLMAIPFLGEHPTRSLLAGGALVLLGVFLAERV